MHDALMASIEIPPLHRHDTNIVSMASVLEGCLVGGFGCTVDHNITAGNSLYSTFSRVTLDELWGYIGASQ